MLVTRACQAVSNTKVTGKHHTSCCYCSARNKALAWRPEPAVLRKELLCRLPTYTDLCCPGSDAQQGFLFPYWSYRITFFKCILIHMWYKVSQLHIFRSLYHANNTSKTDPDFKVRLLRNRHWKLNGFDGKLFTFECNWSHSCKVMAQ